MSVVGITDITEYIWYCQITDYKTYHKSLSNVKIKIIKLLIFGEKTEHHRTHRPWERISHQKMIKEIGRNVNKGKTCEENDHWIIDNLNFA